MYQYCQAGCALIIEKELTSPIAIADRIDSPWNTFFIWLAGTYNISLFPVIEFILKTYKPDSAVIIFAVSSLLFFLVGFVGVPGYVIGVPTMSVSARIFHGYMAKAVPLTNWIALIGWQTIVLVSLVFIFKIILIKLFQVPSNYGLDLSLIIASSATFVVPLVGHHWLAHVQKVMSFVIVMTSLSIIFMLRHSVSIPNLTMFKINSVYDIMEGLSLALIAGALSWSLSASDFSRFTLVGKPRKMFMVVSMGGMIGNGLLLLSGAILYYGRILVFTNGGVLYSPLVSSNSSLFLFIFTLLCVSLFATNYVNSYSSAFNFSIGTGISLTRTSIIIMDSIIVIFFTWVILFHDFFLTAITTFLDTLGLIVGPWSGVMGTNIIFLLSRNGGFKADFSLSGAARKLNNWIFVSSLAISLLFYQEGDYRGALLRLVHDRDVAPLVGFFISIFIVSVVNCMMTRKT